MDIISQGYIKKMRIEELLLTILSPILARMLLLRWIGDDSIAEEATSSLREIINKVTDNLRAQRRAERTFLDIAEEDADGNQCQDHRCGHLSPVDRKFTDEIHDTRRKRHLRLAVYEHQRKKKFRPGRRKYKTKRGANAGKA